MQPTLTWSLEGLKCNQNIMGQILYSLSSHIHNCQERRRGKQKGIISHQGNEHMEIKPICKSPPAYTLNVRRCSLLYDMKEMLWGIIENFASLQVFKSWLAVLLKGVLYFKDRLYYEKHDLFLRKF